MSNLILKKIKEKLFFSKELARYLVNFPIYFFKTCEDAPSNPEILAFSIDDHDESIPKIIWIYWHDETCPKYIENIVNKIKNMNSDHDVFFLNKSTIRNYIDDYMMHRDDISITMKSDLIRLELLKKHGGIWIDSTSMVFKDFSWVHEVGRNKNFNIIGYFRRKSTVDSQYPVVESWFLATKKEDSFISAWLEEFKKITLSGPEAYYNKISDRSDYSLLSQNIPLPKYLLVYLSCQIVMRNFENFSFYLKNTDEIGFFYQEQKHWSSWKTALVLAAEGKPEHPPEIVKLTRVDRLLLNTIIKYKIYRNKSIICEFLK